MAKRYLSAHQLNKLIEKLENHVLYVDSDGEPQYIVSPTRKSIADRFRDILNQTTGRVLTYEEAKERFDVLDPDNDYSREQYYNQLRELNNSPIREQLTPSGYMKKTVRTFLNSHLTRLEETVTEYDIDFSKLSNRDMTVLIERAGRDAQRLAHDLKELYGYKEGSNMYDSNVFYDYLVQEYSLLMEEKML